MSKTDEPNAASVETTGQTKDLEGGKGRSLSDLSAYVLATAGVGYLPLAPGTWGSLVGIAIYFSVWLVEFNLGIALLFRGYEGGPIQAWLYSANLVLLLLFCLAGVWAAGRVSYLSGKKDPSEVVVDEVMGQLIVFLFIPFTTSWWLIGAGFLLFRLFDIWKPYPIDSLQSLPGGIGVCADDLLAGVYAGVCLNIIYSVSLSF